MSLKPQVSVVIPAYQSQETVAACLRSLGAQTLKDFEVILVDSSPSDQCERIVTSEFRWVNYEHVQRRMLPHEARNYGVEKASADLIVFTDPDIYAVPIWLDRLVHGQLKYGGIIVGSVSCYDRRWLDLGVHLAKFDQWLPGGDVRSVEVAPTLNLLCTRGDFDQIGGFPGEYMIGDAVFSWRAAERGITLSFVPGAEVVHHHIASMRSFLQERYSRGREFGGIRVRRGLWDRSRAAAHLAVTLFPLRLAKLISRTYRHAAKSGQLADALLTAPMIALGHSAWLLGEASAFTSFLRK